MKRLLVILFATLLAGAGAFADESNLKNQLHVIFLGSFEDEKVDLYSAEKLLFSLYLHTEPTSGTAGFAEVSASQGTLKLRVDVLRLKISKEAEVTLSKGSYFYVSLNNNKLSFEQTRTPQVLD